MPVWIARIALFSLAALIAGSHLRSVSAQGEALTEQAKESTRTAESTPLVSSVADPAHWEILGTNDIHPTAIRRSIVQHPEYLELSYPDSHPDDFVSRLKTLIERGYRHKGYAEATVAIARKPGDRGLTIRIHEGPKYRSGHVEIVGAQNLDTDRIIEWCRTVVPKVESDFVLAMDEDDKPARVRKLNGTLAGPEEAEVSHSTPGKPIWRAGEDISFARPSWDSFNKSFRQSLEAQGFYGTTFETMAVPDPKTKTGVLRIIIEEEGPQVRVGDITVDGLKNIDRKHLLNHLNLKPGQPMSGDRCREIEAWLRRSGRFVRFHCLAVPRILEPELADVFIDVRETVHTVPLNQPLTAAQQTMVRLAEWLENRNQSDYDLILELDLAESLRFLQKHDPDYLPGPLQKFPQDIVVRVVFTPQGDMLVERRNYSGEVQSALLMTGKLVFLREGDFGEIIDYGGKRSPRPMMQLMIRGIPENPAANETSFVYGLGIQSDDQESTKIEFEPVVGIRSLGEDHIRPVKGRPGEFTVPELAGSLLKIDPETGRPIEGKLHVLSFSTRRGEFQSQLASMKTEFRRLGFTARPAGKHETWHLLTRSAIRLIDWMAAVDPQFQAGLINRLASQQVWAPVLQSLSRLIDDSRFTVPADGQRIEAQIKAQLLRALLGAMVNKAQNAAVAQFAMLFGQLAQTSMSSLEIFPFQSLPWQLNRDVELLMTDRAEGTVKLTDRMRAADFGPVSGFYASLLLRSLSARHGKYTAHKTLEKLDDFPRDREWLLTEGSLPQAILTSAAQAVRRLNRDETIRFIRSVSGQVITPEQAESLKRTLPQSLIEPVGPALGEFTDRLWLIAFRPLIRDYLERQVLDGESLEAQAQQLAAWGRQKQKAREYSAARDSFQKSLALYEKYQEQEKIPRDSRQARHLRATLLYILAMNHDLRGAQRPELLQMQIETGEAIAERMLVNAGVNQVSRTDEDGQAGKWQLARLYGVSGLVSRLLGQEAESDESFRKSLSLYKDGDPSIHDEYATFISQYALLLATATAEDVRDLESAGKLAKGASDLTGNRNTDCLAILAATLAARGDYLRAWQVQKAAIRTATLSRQRELEIDAKNYRVGKPATRKLADRRIDLQKLR